MKPSFALNFTDDAVVLLHRSGRGWIEVGQAHFAEPDFAESLAYLRSTALEISPKGFASKLLIPPSQILRMTVEVTATDKDMVRKEIATALEGRTPYDVADLVFDWSGKAPSVEVAVVAKETLDEAEAFATEHKLNPLSFGTIAPVGFDRDPFFGPSSVAKDFLPKGKSVQADTDVTEILPAPQRMMPEEASVPEPVAEVEAPVLADEASVDEAPEPVAEATPEPVIAPEPVVAEVAEPAAEPEPVPEPATEVVAEVAPVEVAAPISETVPETEPEPAPSTMAERTDEPPQAVFKLDDLPPAPKMGEPKLSVTDEAPMALDVEDEEQVRPSTMSESLRRAALKSAAPLAAPPVALNVPDIDDSDLPPAPAQAILAAFASRRNADASKGAVADPRLRIARDQTAETGKRVPPPVTARPSVKAPAAERPPTPKVAKFSYDDPVPTPPRLPGDPPVGPVGVIGKASKGLKSLGTLVSPGSGAGKSAKAKPADTPEVGEPPVVAEGVNELISIDI